MTAAQQGDRAAYDQLLREIGPYLRDILGRVHDADEIEDVLQDVLIALHHARGEYDSRRPFKPWLLAICRPRSIDHLRAASRRLLREETLSGDLAQDLVEVEPRPEDRVPRDGLSTAIASLPPRQRQALELLKLRELSLREASDLTGQSIESLKIATHRAMHSMRRRLAKYLD
jgi:RNA polymerase sigma-70 factor (ECF subfamily)